MERLIHNLFFKRKRRIKILMIWHCAQPVDGKTISDVMYKFFNIVLYKDVTITITNSYISFFRNESGLNLKYEVLTDKERRLLADIYVDRYRLFGTVQRYQSGGWKLHGYTAKKDLIPARYRKEMIRDFIHVSLAIRPLLRVAFIEVLQMIIEKDHTKKDEFLRNVHNKLQGIGNINNLLVIYD